MSDNPHRARKSDSSPAEARKHKSHVVDSANPAHDSGSAAMAAAASLQRALRQRGKPSPADLISVQRAAGNRALQRLLNEHSAEISKAKGLAAQSLTAEKKEEHQLNTALQAGETQAANLQALGKIEEERGHGKPIDSRLGKHVGRKLGADFNGVRIHTDPRADMLNRAFKSQAFTVGRDIFFSRNAYQPHHLKSQRLITHELVHVVQQGGDKSGKVQAKFTVAPKADPYEREAAHAAKYAAPRQNLGDLSPSQPSLAGAAAMPMPDRGKLQPGARAGIVQRAPEDANAGGADQRGLPDLRKGDVVLTRRQLLQNKKDLRAGIVRRPDDMGDPSGAQLDLTKNATIAPGAANDMVQRLWAGRMKLMKPEFGYSALAMDRKDVVHSEDGQRVRRDPEEILEGSEVYRTSDKKLAEFSADQTKKWSEIEAKIRKAYYKATSDFDITDDSKKKAAVLAAYALAGKLRPKDMFAAEFTTMAHQATALMPAIRELINAESKGKRRSRKGWGKAKNTPEGAREWVERNMSKINIPAGVAGIDPARVKPELMPAAMHFLTTKNRPKWQFQGIL